MKTKMTFLAALIIAANQLFAVITLATVNSEPVPSDPLAVNRPQSSSIGYSKFANSNNNGFVEVNSWDVNDGIAFGLPNTGFAWRVKGIGGFINPNGVNGDIIYIPNVSDIDIALTSNSNSEIITLVVAYYRPSINAHQYEVYQMNNTTYTFTQILPPTTIAPISGFGLVNVDGLLTFNQFVITCHKQGTVISSGIYTVAGTVSGTMVSTVTRLMNLSTGFMQPDVALSRISSATPSTMISWVMLNSLQTQVRVYEMDFATFMSSSTSYAPILSNTTSVTTGFRAGPPRIDAYDHSNFLTNGWAWVCEYKSTTSSRIMLRHKRNGTLSSAIHITGLALTNVTGFNNIVPVISYLTDHERIMLGWHSTYNAIPGFSLPYGVYLGACYNMLTNTIVSNDLYTLSTIPDSSNKAPIPTLAFASNNTHYFLMTYSIYTPSIRYYMRVKSTSPAWGVPPYFKTSDNEELHTDITTEYTTSIYPSLTTDRITIEISNIDSQCEIKAFSMNGAEVMSQILNENKNEVDLSYLENGMYIIHIYQNGRNIKTERIVKN